MADQPDLTPEQVAEWRRQEFVGAMQQLGVQAEVLNFADFGLATLPFRNLALPLLNLLRGHDFGAVFTFHPYEITAEFDHPDHNRTGEATRFAATAQNVKNLATPPLIDSKTHPATATRPDLFFWTTDKTQATHQQKLGKKARKRRNRYLKENYPSQFPAAKEKRWGTIFDRAVKKKEYYQRVR